ncbi:hypothetical protein CARUB_v10025493mg [Capsella rubella]|uniref:F-box associated beta-propeller type 3 domain-containing protein n=1 Tax=Capsella rubella TaxID=81985 RepID=R0HHR1_9BRAS|nr:putative F-box protein At5g44220 [Capsella rubella]EOA29219.1 hypothetical protein CARUB_v10025493mg [Capsella rubella]
MESASSSSSRIKRRKISDGTKLPMDLIMEILKRLPAETLANLCESKPLASIIRNRHFKKLFFTECSSRPGRLFFFIKHEDGSELFSSRLPTRSPASGEGEALYVATHHITFGGITKFSCLHGLFSYESYRFGRSKITVYNSSTRVSTPLPDFDGPRHIFQHMLGYDPVDGVYKVLCMDSRYPCDMLRKKPRNFFEVLTLGDDHSSWKMIQDGPTHTPYVKTHICINGVLYYDAYVFESKETGVISFDLRSEQFRLISGPPCEGLFVKKMARYEGKLAIISILMSEDNGNIVLWVLEDAVKHEWVKKVFVFPSLWKSLLQCNLHFLNITHAGEFILTARYFLTQQCYVLCCDPKTQRVRKFVIEGIPKDNLQASELTFCPLHHIFSTQVESLMFL